MDLHAKWVPEDLCVHRYVMPYCPWPSFLPIWYSSLSLGVAFGSTALGFDASFLIFSTFFLPFLNLRFQNKSLYHSTKKKTKNKRLCFLFPYLSAVWLPVGWFTFSFSQNIPFRSPTMSLGFVFLSGGTRIPLRAHLPTSQVKALGHRIISVPIFLHTNAFSLQKYKYFILLASLALFLCHFRILFYTPSFRAGLIVFLGNAYSLFVLKFKC